MLDLSCAGAPSDTAPHLDPSKSELLSILTASVSKSTPLLGRYVYSIIETKTHPHDAYSVLGAFWPDEEGATNNLKDECGTYMMGLRKDEDRGTRTLFAPKFSSVNAEQHPNSDQWTLEGRQLLYPLDWIDRSCITQTSNDTLGLWDAQKQDATRKTNLEH